MQVDLEHPDGATTAAVLLHPHPDMGGDRYNHVIGTLYRALPQAGIAAVRFDFTSSDVDVAAAEARAAIDEVPAGLAVVVVGYSFGAMVASRTTDERVRGWFLVAPPIDHVDPALGADPRPKALAVPEHDFSPPAHVAERTAGWSATEQHVVPGNDHFLGTGMPDVVELVRAWIAAR